MATFTNNFNLKKPDPTDAVRIEDLNENADKIDEALGLKADMPVDAFDRANDSSFLEDCGGALAPVSIGQLMVGPGGRLFVSVGNHEFGNPYRKWLPLIDDNGYVRKPNITTFSAEKINVLLSGKADMVGGCVQQNGENVMGFVRTLLPDDNADDIRKNGIYTTTGVGANLPPEIFAHGVLEVINATHAAMVLQRFTSVAGDVWTRSWDGVHESWSTWKKLTA